MVNFGQTRLIFETQVFKLLELKGYHEFSLFFRFLRRS